MSHTVYSRSLWLCCCCCRFPEAADRLCFLKVGLNLRPPGAAQQTAQGAVYMQWRHRSLKPEDKKTSEQTSFSKCLSANWGPFNGKEFEMSLWKEERQFVPKENSREWLRKMCKRASKLLPKALHVDHFHPLHQKCKKEKKGGRTYRLFRIVPS